MATNCCGRRLSELLQEQQEPFFVHRGGSVGERERRGVSVSNVEGARSMLCGVKAVRKALLWDLAGCFSCGARDRFRRLPRSGDIGGEKDRDGGRQLSPVSVLQLRSDEESTSTEQGHWDEDESKPSTSASSPSSDHHPKGGAASPRFTFYSRTVNGAKVRAMEGEDSSKFQTTKREESLAIVSAWERISADISRIPRMVELDLSGSAREWRQRIGEEEARRVGESIEAMIFEEVRWEAVRDMLCFSRVCVPAAGMRTGNGQSNILLMM